MSALLGWLGFDALDFLVWLVGLLAVGALAERALPGWGL